MFIYSEPISSNYKLSARILHYCLIDFPNEFIITHSPFLLADTIALLNPRDVIHSYVLCLISRLSTVDPIGWVLEGFSFR